MPFNESPEATEARIKELDDYLSKTKDIREWKRLQTVRLWLSGYRYEKISQTLQVSISYIAQTRRKYLEKGISELKIQYKGSKSYLEATQKAEIMEWLKTPKNRNLSELERWIMVEYDVVFKSPESYYKLLKESQLSWQKATPKNPRSHPEEVIKVNRRIAELLKELWPKIESGELIVYALDECHLQGDDICNYLWGDPKNRENILVANLRDRQTYYGALNLMSKEFIVRKYSSGNGLNTVKFIKEIKALHPGKKILLIWDGATYHRGEEFQNFLSQENGDKSPKDWSIICQRFATYAPEENPVEGIWLQVKNFIRRFYYLCKTFAIAKRLFQFFFDYQLFNVPDLKKYDAFAQMI